MKGAKGDTMEERICNSCGRVLKDQAREDALTIIKEWGYPSEKDLQRHRFILCEKCYDRLLLSFVRPVEIESVTEV